MLQTTRLASLLALLPLAYAALGPRTEIVLTNEVVAPDGFPRSAVLINGGGKGVQPGPLIQGRVGDTFKINVVNKLQDKTMPTSTSIHWHGLLQRGTNWADGPAFVTQCPIVPNEAFEYAFKASHPGTFWYHSHLSTQYCDGARGPMVVYNPRDPYARFYDVDDSSTIITLEDWYHVPSLQVQGVPTPDSTLINGHGRSKDGPKMPLSVINVEHGKRYRIRLVSMVCDPNYRFSIDSHTMFIIEADADYTQMVEVDSLQIFAGQRYSFILHATQNVGNYWIRANPNVGAQGFDGGINSAILRYKGAPCEEPTSIQTNSTRPLLETDLHPLYDPKAPGRPVPGGADVVIDLATAFNLTSALYTVNNKTFVPPTLPVLLQILSGAHSAQELLPTGSVYTLPRNKVVELTLPGGAIGGPHPIHLHGHLFSVVRSAGNSTYNFDNPVRRDVVSNGVAGDLVTIRFVTDNPGPWLLHCHIDWHFELGFAAVFAEDPQGTKIANPVPAAWSKLCPAYEKYASKPEKLSMGKNPMHRRPGH
ncbi:ferroxidase, multicopper oxidase [Pleurotus ostreatus]|nr:ferroxidase, multicopper oxidase [Pleurotus ostreatus]